MFILISQVYQRVFDHLPADIPTASPLDDDISLLTFEWTPLIVALIQICAAHLCYVTSKFACKICIQGFSFAFPISLTIPVCISLLIASCGIRFEDVCFFEGWLPKYLFWKCPPGDFFQVCHLIKLRVVVKEHRSRELQLYQNNISRQGESTSMIL